jgi:hypothetical protein
VSRADADFYGIHLSASGRLINPGALKRAEPKPEEKHPLTHGDTAGRIIEVLRSIRHQQGAPRVTARFSGDLARPESIFVGATAEGRRSMVKGVYFSGLDAGMEYTAGRLRLHRLHLRDAHGALDAEGSLDMTTGRADFQIRSTLDLEGLVRALKIKSPLEECVFYEPPLFEAAGSADLKARTVKATGRVEMGRFGVRSVPFEKISATFAVDGSRFFVNDVLIQHRKGRVTARAMSLPGDFRAQLESDIDIRAFQPFTNGKTAEMMGELEFIDPPVVRLSLSGTGLDPKSWTGTGETRLGRTKIRGVGMNEASAKIEIKDRAITYRDMRVVRPEGAGTGSFTYDFENKMVRLENVRTNLIPPDVAMWIEPKIVKDILPYRTRGAPDLRINGVVQTNGDEKTNLEILVEAPRGLDYVFMKKNLPFSSASGRLLFKAGRLYLSNVRGRLFGGTVRAGADISIKKEKPGYTARIDVEGVDFESVTNLYFNYKDSRGRLDGYYDFRGSDDPRAMAGTGTARVTDGNVFAIPVLGPLSGILNALVPGMGYNTARKASATFAVRNGVIDTSDFVVDGRGFAMIGGGKLLYIDDKIDFSIRINAQGLPGILLFPVSKIMEYGADGTLSKPGWRPKIIPKL